MHLWKEIAFNVHMQCNLFDAISYLPQCLFIVRKERPNLCMEHGFIGLRIVGQFIVK